MFIVFERPVIPDIENVAYTELGPCSAGLNEHVTIDPLETMRTHAGMRFPLAKKASVVAPLGVA